MSPHPTPPETEISHFSISGEPLPCRSITAAHYLHSESSSSSIRSSKTYWLKRRPLQLGCTYPAGLLPYLETGCVSEVVQHNQETCPLLETLREDGLFLSGGYD